MAPRPESWVFSGQGLQASLDTEDLKKPGWHSTKKKSKKHTCMMTWMQMRGNCAIKLFTSYMSSDHLCMNTVNEPPLKMFFFPSTAFFKALCKSAQSWQSKTKHTPTHPVWTIPLILYKQDQSSHIPARYLCSQNSTMRENWTKWIKPTNRMNAASNKGFNTKVFFMNSLH